MRTTISLFFFLILALSCRERSTQQTTSQKSVIPCDRVILPVAPYPNSVDSTIVAILSKEDPHSNYISYILTERHVKSSSKKVRSSDTLLNDIKLNFDNYEKDFLVGVVTTETNSTIKEWIFTFKDYDLQNYSMDTLKNRTHKQCIAFFNMVQIKSRNPLNTHLTQASKIRNGKNLDHIDQFINNYYYIPDNSNFYMHILDSMQELIQTKDTPFNTLGTIIARKVKIQPFNNLSLTTLHISDTTERIFLCSHNSNLKLIDTYYIGNSKGRKGHSHEIREEIINSNTLRYYHCDIKFEGDKIDTLQYYYTTVSINNQGKFYLTEE